MTDFNPGKGWKLGVTGSLQIFGEEKEYVEHVSEGRYERWFPVPAVELPKTPWIVFEITHTSGGTSKFMRHANGQLLGVHSGEFWHEDPKDVEGYKILSAPLYESYWNSADENARRTAENVLKKISVFFASGYGKRNALAKVASEFGVKWG